MQEQLVLKDQHNEKHNWEKDYSKYVVPLIEENQPCYILYRLDSKSSLGYEWLFISWSPDTAPIRQKMLYASTKATLKQEFGSSQIKEELHGTVLIEIDAGSELTEQFLYEELHPTNSLHRPKFAKPKGPPGRGPKRMTKNQ
ncbi:hypothetical protein HUJ04_006437 [Dendroctonus ponderosae]|nr:hypothetical protein HUJ04_006437 [Dendroctonus ponderosae]